MYPFIRSANAFLFSKFRPKLRLTETHISHFICWPWDIDMWGELNNGRALSLFDIGRYGLLARQGSVLEFYLKYKMSFTVAGLSVRYRRRMRPFRLFEMKTRVIFWDDKFLYLEQVINLPDGQCAAHSLCRKAVIENRKIIQPAVAIERTFGLVPEQNTCPEWVKNWIDAEATRPWPPEFN